jgi:hypothetical protein
VPTIRANSPDFCPRTGEVGVRSQESGVRRKEEGRRSQEERRRKKKIRELHKKDKPILWDGHPARFSIISRQDACTTRHFGIFFYLEISNFLRYSATPLLPHLLLNSSGT